MIERIHAASDFAEALIAAGIVSLDALSSRSLGSVITDCRSSWVRQHTLDSFVFFTKTYDYPTKMDRWRGTGRTTLLASSRIKRERTALKWLSEHGFAAPRVLAWGEHRQLGFLHRAVQVTKAWPGQAVDQLLAHQPKAEGAQLLAALALFVKRLHAAGFRDRNLDLRNILAQRTDSGWEFCKIDSPRFRLVAKGQATDKLATADWQRLRASCQAAGHELATTQN